MARPPLGHPSCPAPPPVLSSPAPSCLAAWLAQDLDSLSTLPRLKYLSLLDNPVTKQPNYRLYLVARCKKLKVLDFRKVKQKASGRAWGWVL